MKRHYPNTTIRPQDHALDMGITVKIKVLDPSQRTLNLPIGKIYYIKVVDNKVFIYGNKNSCEYER
ncbi:MAG: hypothetical protein RR630_05605 [Coprobacillus sp.]